MFRRRSGFATNEEVLRQTRLWRIISSNDRRHKLTTYIEKKTGAFYHHASVDPVKHAKIMLALDDIGPLYDYDDRLLFRCPKAQSRVYERVQSLILRPDDIMYLTAKPSQYTTSPSRIAHHQVADYEISVREQNPITLFDFEALCFNNYVRFTYYRDTSFATYVYENIKYAMGVTDTKSLIGNRQWQARLAVLIEHLKFSDAATMNAFYDDTINYDGVTYDTSFVPKYDVKALRPAVRIDTSRVINDKAMLKYHDTLDVVKHKHIDAQHLPIFKTFPFKDGHYVRPNGTMVFLDLKRVNETNVVLHGLCSIDDIEGFISDLMRAYSHEELISYTVYASDVSVQAIGLLALRQAYGSVVIIGEHKISLPTANEVLSWTTPTCNREGVLALPAGLSTAEAGVYVSLVRDIANSCATKLGATIACSSYCIPEIYLNSVYSRLVNDAERYVFITILLQYHNSNACKRRRDRLSPKFGVEPIAFRTYDETTDTMTNKYIQNARIMTNNGRIVSSPSLAVPDDANECDPERCPELYEFTDDRLNGLVVYGDDYEHEWTDDVQLAAFITLCISDINIVVDHTTIDRLVIDQAEPEGHGSTCRRVNSDPVQVVFTKTVCTP